MDSIFETDLYIEGNQQPQSFGKARINDLSASVDNGNNRFLNATLALDVPQLVAPPQAPENRTIQSKQVLFETNILNCQIKVQMNSSLFTTFRAFGHRPPNPIRVSGLVPHHLLQYVEDVRKGNGVQLTLTMRLMVEQRVWWVVQYANGTTHNTLANTGIVMLRGFWQEVRIAASDWVTTFLPSFRFDGPRYIEIPPVSLSSLNGSIGSHMQQALESLKAGGAGYRAVPANCLNALDALAKSLNYPGISGLKELCLSPELPERNKVLHSFKAYVNRWRHDQTTKGSSQEHLPLVTYEEAMFIYVTTVFLLQMIAKNTPMNPDVPGTTSP